MQIIGIDIGTTSICGVVIDAANGKVLKSKTVSSHAFIDGDEPWEKIQSPEKIISLATEILDGFICEETAAIGVTGQMHGIVYTDASGNAVSPLYTWQDERGNQPYKDTTYAQYLGSFSGYGNVTDFYNRENNLRPASAVGYCTIHDYFVMKLCGLKKALMHSSDAASFGLYDIEKNVFEYEVNVDVTADFTIAGTYKNIPVSVAIGDNQASVFSTLSSESDVLLNIGTGSQVSIISDSVLKEADIETRPFFDNKYLVVGAALCGGRAFSILRNFYLQIFNYLKKTELDEVYPIMDKMVGDGMSSLKVDTRFAGTRYDQSITGSVTNITIDNFTPEQLTAGVLHGMADELYNMYKKMNVSCSGLVGSGNGIRKNPALVKIFEQQFGASMKIPAHVEEAAVGAALFAMVATGDFGTSDDVRKLIKYE